VRARSVLGRARRAAQSGLRPAVEGARRQTGKLAWAKPVVLEDAFGVRFVLEPWDAGLKRQRVERAFYRDEFAALQRLVRRGATVFDVGAHVGLHAALFSRWVGPDGRVLAFEPVPDTAWRLRETLALNRCANVEVHELALLDRDGEEAMHVFDPAHADWNSFGHPDYDGTAAAEEIAVHLDTLDEFCARREIERIDFLTVDVEGYEQATLAGARRLLETGAIGALSFEISQVPLAGSGGSARAVFELLAGCGYAAYEFAGPSARFVGPVADSDAYYANYYASRRDLREL
jgi:FkbM family methyltransferase